MTKNKLKNKMNNIIEKLLEKKFVNIYLIFTNSIIFGISLGMIYLKEYFGIYLLFLSLILFILSYNKIQLDDILFYYLYVILTIFFGIIIGFTSILLNYGKPIYLSGILVSCLVGEILTIITAMYLLKSDYILI